MPQKSTENKLVIHNHNGTDMEVDISPSQAAFIAENIRDRCGNRLQTPIEGNIHVFWHHGMSRHLIRKIKRHSAAWRRMHAPGTEFYPYSCADNENRRFQGVLAVPRSVPNASEYIGMRIRELRAAMMFFHPACRKCRWMVVEKSGKNRQNKMPHYYCQKKRYCYGCWPDGMACNCEHYKLKGKSK